MFHLYQSDHLEDLAALLAAVRRQNPLPDPFAVEEVVVPSHGMRRFLSHYLARETGIAANMRFVLPAQLMWRWLREQVGAVPENDPFAPEVMRWRLLALFDRPQFAADESFQAARGALGAYLQRGESARYALAGQLADVFDQYLVYRADWLETWKQGKTLPDLPESQLWQAELWRSLDSGAAEGRHRAALWHRLAAALAAEKPPRALPPRLLVFGISSLAPVYLQLLQLAARHCEVHLFALNPSRLYWGKTVSAGELLSRPDADLSEQGHPLLAALGKQGRDFFDALAEAAIGADIDSYAEAPESPGLLHTLQFHIQSQILPQDGRADWLDKNGLAGKDTDAVIAHLRADAGIEIHSAHSPLRELQILKDRLLALLAEHPDWQPYDIAVLTPHIEPYLPFIEAVFGGSADGRPLPYSVSDVRLSRRQPLLYALESALALLESRFEAEKLLPLLESGIVLERFGLSREDLPLLHDTVAGLNIRWGSDSEMRARYGDAGSLFTWQQGIERLALGWLMPEGAGLWQGVSPWPGNDAHLEVLGRFAALLRLLADTRREWETPAAVPEWCRRVRSLCAGLFAPADDDLAAAQQLEQALAQWQEQTEEAGFSGCLSLQTAVLHLSRFLGGQSEAGFLRGGITFCSMVPMRSLPFKVLCLLGLNDGEFPRNTKAAEFDLIARRPRAGDRTRRDDDRYLFLEALLSARQMLYLSYVGRDIRSDEERAPSTLLNGLTDCIAALAGIGSTELAQKWIISHPLQPFSRRYFGEQPPVAGTRQDYADALNHPQPPSASFIGSLKNGAGESSLKDGEALQQHRFLRFWRNPPRAWLQQQLNWQQPHIGGDWESAEPFAADHRTLSAAYIDARRRQQDFADTAAELSARSQLPAGAIGNLVGQDYAAQAKMLDNSLVSARRLPPQSGRIDTDTGSLNYHLGSLYPQGQIFTLADFPHARAKLSATDQIELLLRHLIYSAATPNAGSTVFLTLPQPLALPPLAQDDARANLTDWIAAYRQGQHAPLPFLPRLNLAAACSLLKKNDWDAARAEAAAVYHKGYQGFAQADYAESRLLYGRDGDEPPYRSDAFQHLTENLLLPLSGCLQALDEG